MNHLIKIDPNEPIREYIRLCYPNSRIMEIALCRKSSGTRFVKLCDLEGNYTETLVVELYF